MPRFRVRQLTTGPKHHFFGYYGMPPWSRSQRRLVCLESDFIDRLPSAEESAAVVLVDPENGRAAELSRTRSWNLQQGALLHWNPLHPDDEVVFNDRVGDEVHAAIVDVNTGHKRHLPRAISGVGRAGSHAASLTYGRLTRLRPVVGYPGAADPNPGDPHPDNDGVFLMDLQTGDSRLIVSIDEVYRRAVAVYPDLKDRHMWFNHTVFNRSASRLLFLARTWNSKGKLDSAMYTVNTDGSDLRLATPWGAEVSHFEWRNDVEIVATFKLPCDSIKTHYLFTDGEAGYKQVGKGFIAGGGHCSVAPDGNWLVSDGSASNGIAARYLASSLEIFNLQTGQGVFLGMFNLGDKRYVSSDVRCDLHPRWNRTGDAICIDAMDTSDWTRQMFIVDLSF